MRATHADICARCHNYIAAGDRIVRHQHGWMHLACCAATEEKP